MYFKMILLTNQNFEHKKQYELLLGCQKRIIKPFSWYDNFILHMNCRNVTVMLKSLYLLPPVEFKIYSMTTQFQKLSLQQKFCLSEKTKLYKT